MSASAPWPPLRRGLVAILRGIRPEETEAVLDVLVEEGFEAIEIPLNSPDPFRSIEIAVRRHGATHLIGAGTVLAARQVDALHAVGGRLVVSPNVEPEVLVRAAELGLTTMPGVFTATEAFRALRHGASALKFFPASVLGPGGVAALRAVLPSGTVLGAVGGVAEDNLAAFAAAGVTAFGLGSNLYKPGDTVETVRVKARRLIAGYDAALGGAAG